MMTKNGQESARKTNEGRRWAIVHFNCLLRHSPCVTFVYSFIQYFFSVFCERKLAHARLHFIWLLLVAFYFTDLCQCQFAFSHYVQFPMPPPLLQPSVRHLSLFNSFRVDFGLDFDSIVVRFRVDFLSFFGQAF